MIPPRWGSSQTGTSLDEVEQLSGWCTENNQILNSTKMKEEIVLDFRRRKTDIQPLFIGGECVESDQLSPGCAHWGPPDLEHQHQSHHQKDTAVYFLRTLRNNHLSQKLLAPFYRCSIDSMEYCCWRKWERLNHGKIYFIIMDKYFIIMDTYFIIKWDVS